MVPVHRVLRRSELIHSWLNRQGKQLPWVGGRASYQDHSLARLGLIWRRRVLSLKVCLTLYGILGGLVAEGLNWTQFRTKACDCIRSILTAARGGFYFSMYSVEQCC